jgi:hypothetical protein
MPERRARMLAESTLPGADYQVPIRGRSMGSRPSDAMPSFASEEREARQEAASARQAEAVQQIPLAKSDAVAQWTAIVEGGAPAAEAETHDEGLLKAGRIWVSSQEIDDEASVAPEAELEDEFEAEAGLADDVDDLGQEDEVAPEFERRSEPELIPVSASVFDDDFFRASRARGEGATSGAGGRIAVATAPTSAAPVNEVRVFAGASASNGEQSEADELDIPAFLRRSR